MNDRIHQKVEVDRLRDQCVETRFQRARAVFGGRVARAGDNGGLPLRADPDAAKSPDKFVAIFDGHADI
jgi:hypothetical protein